MSRISLALFLALIFFVVGGTIFLMTWDIPAPLEKMEQIIPNDRLSG